MFCTGKEQLTCNEEKMGCEGCYYNNDNNIKVLFVGDVHNHSYMFEDIKRLDEEYKFDRIIFLGDYVDDWNTTNLESLDTLHRIICLKQNQSDKYILCIGNHELSYLGYPCSGHKFYKDTEVRELLEHNIDLFTFYYKIKLGEEYYYCSHAGFNNGFIKESISDNEQEVEQILEDINKHKLDNLQLLSKCSYIRGGDNTYSSFVWCDKTEHKYFGLQTPIINKQIVGHTPVKQVVTENNITFIDTHSTYRDNTPFGDKSYLMWSNNKFTPVF